MRRSSLFVARFGARVGLAGDVRGQQAPSRRAPSGRPTAAISRSTRYSPLDQINADNFNKLEVAWRFKTDSLGPRPEFNFQSTPLMVERRRLLDGRHAPRGRRARRGDRRDAVDAQRERGQARRGGAAPALGPRPRVLDRRQATSASSTSRPAISWSRSTRRPAVRVAGFGKNGIVDLKQDDDQADRSRSPARSACTPTPIVAEGRHRHRRRAPARRRAEEQDQREGLRPRLRRAHRQAAVDLPHHSAARRVRQRHLGERLVVVHRQRRRLGADDASTKSSASVYLPVELPTGDYYGGHRPGNEPVRREPRRARSEDRQAQVALPARPPRHLGHRHPVRADPRRHHRQRPPIKAVAQPTKQAGSTSSIA